MVLCARGGELEGIGMGMGVVGCIWGWGWVGTMMGKWTPPSPLLLAWRGPKDKTPAHPDP